MTQGIVLCGFMGAGKSHVGKLVAGRLGFRFEDLDDIITTLEAMPIAEIFERHGQDHFRKLEMQYLQERIDQKERVLSLGGGSLQNQEVVDAIKAHNLMVFINPSFDEIIERVAGKRKRPLVLNDTGAPKSVEELHADLYPLFQQRLRFYSQADVEFVPQKEWDLYQSASILIQKICEHGYTI
jgi:shikimate kinase